MGHAEEAGVGNTRSFWGCPWVSRTVSSCPSPLPTSLVVPVTSLARVDVEKEEEFLAAGTRP